MGWDFCKDATRAQTIAQRTKEWNPCLHPYPSNDFTLDFNRRRVCLKHCSVGNILWTVWSAQERVDGGEWQETERYIGCDLLQSQRGYGWGYKSLGECMHPYYYTCPLSYLEMVPQVACAEWRAKVREAHACTARVKNLADGTRIRFETPISFGRAGKESEFLARKDGRIMKFFAVSGRFTCRIRKETFESAAWSVVG